jgi:hypothetical protein
LLVNLEKLAEKKMAEDRDIKDHERLVSNLSQKSPPRSASRSSNGKLAQLKQSVGIGRRETTERSVSLPKSGSEERLHQSYGDG